MARERPSLPTLHSTRPAFSRSRRRPVPFLAQRFGLTFQVSVIMWRGTPLPGCTSVDLPFRSRRSRASDLAIADGARPCHAGNPHRGRLSSREWRSSKFQMTWSHVTNLKCLLKGQTICCNSKGAVLVLAYSALVVERRSSPCRSGWGGPSDGCKWTVNNGRG